METFWLCFVPIFVAVDVVGVLPMFMGITYDFDRPRLHRVILQSVGTATIVALGFLALGRGMFRLLGITMADFMVAGGVLLFTFAITDLLSMEKKQRHVEPGAFGAVPLGVPLLAGPAVLTTSLVLLPQYGAWLTAASLVINMLIAGLLFWTSRPVYHALGETGARTFSKIASILLAAIAVMLVRKGVTSFFIP